MCPAASVFRVSVRFVIHFVELWAYARIPRYPASPTVSDGTSVSTEAVAVDCDMFVVLLVSKAT